MALIEFYPAIKDAHIGLALLSGALFAVRGIGTLCGMRFALSASVRRASVVIDTSLLTTAVLLLVALQLNPFTTPWLQMKLGLLVAYIGFGALALKRAPTHASRAIAFAAALLCYTAMIAVAHTHQPLGFISLLA